MWLRNCSKLAINWENSNYVTICQHALIVNFFWRCCVSFANYSYWSKFHVNIIIGSGFRTILVYKGSARNSEIRNNPFYVLSIIWWLGQVRDTKLGTNASNEKLLNAAKWHGYNIYRFWVIKEKPTGGETG